MFISAIMVWIMSTVAKQNSLCCCDPFIKVCKWGIFFQASIFPADQYFTEQVGTFIWWRQKQEPFSSNCLFKKKKEKTRKHGFVTITILHHKSRSCISCKVVLNSQDKIICTSNRVEYALIQTSPLKTDKAAAAAEFLSEIQNVVSETEIVKFYFDVLFLY